MVLRSHSHRAVRQNALAAMWRHIEHIWRDVAAYRAHLARCGRIQTELLIQRGEWMEDLQLQETLTMCAGGTFSLSPILIFFPVK